MRRILLALFFLLVSAPASASAEDTWRAIDSPHFRVLTNSSEGRGRDVAVAFEQMRHVFTVLLHREEIESGAPLTIVAARDAATLRELEPALWKAQGEKIAGEFHRGWEKQFALVRLDTWGDQNQVVVYHEYTHSMMHANTHWLPTWLDEGLAEFYSYTRFQGNRTFIGAPSLRARLLRQQALLPVQKVFAVNSHSPEYRDELQMQLFYAQSWAMVHYMIFGPGMGNGAKLDTFINKLEDRESQEQAFHEVFGDFKPFQDALSAYTTQFAFLAGVLPGDTKVDPKTYSARVLSPAETAYQLGCFHIGAHDRVAGRAMIQKALQLDPKLAGAHEELAYADFEEGKDAEAHEEWQQAVSLDPTLPRSTYALAMSGKPLAQRSPEELRVTQTTLRHITEFAPKFAPPYVQLALIEWRLGSMQQAFTDAHKAEALEPSRAGYRTLTGSILLRGRKPALAADYARYVAGHWFGPDHDEAVDLWNAVPPANRGEGAALVLDVPSGATVVRGRLLDVTCPTNPEGRISVTLQPEAPVGAKPLILAGAGRFRSGWSDTLWWGSDHFSLCHHVVGRPAVVAYQPSGEKAGEFEDLEIRDDFPTPASITPAIPALPTTTASPQSTGSQAAQAMSSPL